MRAALAQRGAAERRAAPASCPREQLLTLRYEDLVASPGRGGGERSPTFLGTRVSKVALYGGSAPKVGAWRTRLRGEDAELVEKVAREELRRLGYVWPPERRR